MNFVYAVVIGLVGVLLSVASAASAQTVPFIFEATGTVSAADAARWPGVTPGDTFTVMYDLQVDISAPTVSSSVETRWSSTGSVTVTVGSRPMEVEFGPCAIQVLRDPFFDGRDFFRLSLSVSEPGGLRFWIVQLRTEPATQLDLAAPPCASIVNMLPIAQQNANQFAFYEQRPDLSTSMNATIDSLLASDIVITTQPAGDIVDPESAVVFEVAAEGVELSYSWRRDGVPLTDSDFVSGSDTPQLTVFATDAARYDVVVSNLGGSVTSDAAILGIRNLCPADQNFDGILSPADFNAWILNYNAGC